MILGAGRHFDARRFAEGLALAMRRVVPLEMRTPGGQGSCTGFLLTRSLVLCPAYALQEAAFTADRVDVLLSDGGEPRRLHVMADGFEFLQEPGSQGEVPLRLALLSLPEELDVPAMEFSPNEAAVGGAVAILFYHGTAAPRLSVGNVTAIDGAEVAYDADTMAGSGGAPLFDREWRIAGIHMLGKFEQGHNRGVGRAALMRLLQRSTRWPEIAAHYRMLDVVAVQKALATAPAAQAPTLPSAARIRASLRMTIDPATLDDAERDELEEVVLPAPDGRWMLIPNLRKATIAAVGSLRALRPYAAATDGAGGQQVIDRILAGPPYDLEAVSEDDLAWWIQVADWFTAIEPAIPTPRDITRVLQRKRTRSRLQAIAGSDFRGREDELADMERWFASDSRAPFAVSGIGGVGKSALVAHFAARLPEETVLLWLDFDRADLAPDNAASILSRLVEQALPQVEDQATPAQDQLGRKTDVEQLRKDLLALLRKVGNRPILIVLDSFEAAQYAGRYQELWPELEGLGNDLAPAKVKVKVLVSGRAPQPNLRLHQQPALSCALKGLSDDQARAWLKNCGIGAGPVVDQVVAIARGLPLNLRLAYRLYKSGGDLANVPARLPDELVAGFIYGRIIKRVHNQQMADLAKGALVLQRVTAPMLRPVLGSAVKLPPGEPADLIRELAREAALVEGTEQLQVRPEVRAAALALLESSEPAFVRKVDEEAARWYAAQDTNDPQSAAQLVYHRLRLADIAGAQSAWRPGCEIHLQYAAENLRNGAREWLESRLGATDAGTAAADVYEQEASDRIRAARGKGKTRQVRGILDERTERSGGGALVFHEAYELRDRGERAEALQLLQDAGIEGTAGEARERALLAALIHAENGSRADAEEILGRWCREDQWKDRRDAVTERAAVYASRICLAVDIEAEEDLAQSLRAPHSQGTQLGGIAPMDLLTSSARKEAEWRGSSPVSGSRLWTVALPTTSQQWAKARFLEEIDAFRRTTLLEPETDRMARARHEVLFEGKAGTATELGARTGAQARVVLAAWKRLVLCADGAFFDTLRLAETESRVSRLLESVFIVQALFTEIEGLRLGFQGGRRKERALEEVLVDMIEVLPLRSTFKLLSRNPLDFVGTMKKRALQFCDGPPKPLDLLVERLAGGQKAEK